MNQSYPMQSALEVATEIENGLAPETVIKRDQEAIDTFESDIRAFETLQADAAVNTAASAKGPLRGISIGVKDIFDTHDMPTHHGSPIYKNNQPQTDAALVAMCRGAGASILGKTVTTEFAFFHPGKTKNPSNLAHTPGGSSSGSAAGVAAGMMSAALGSQTGGSVIRPASYCGVSGYKPSFRLFPSVGMKVFAWSLDTPGFFAKRARDCAFIAGTISGRDLAVDEDDNSAPHIGIYKGHLFGEASPEMQEALAFAAEAAETSGATVQDIDTPQSFRDGSDRHALMQNFEAAIACRDDLDRHANQMSETLLAALQAGQMTPPAEYDAGRAVARRARKDLRTLFDEVDVLIAPSAPSAAPFGLEATGDPKFNKIWTMVGAPCINVPVMQGADNLSLGVQVIAPFGRDKRALQAAHWLEAALGNRD